MTRNSIPCCKILLLNLTPVYTFSRVQAFFFPNHTTESKYIENVDLYTVTLSVTANERTNKKVEKMFDKLFVEKEPISSITVHLSTFPAV